jgi:hypothetical protein
MDAAAYRPDATGRRATKRDLRLAAQRVGLSGRLPGAIRSRRARDPILRGRLRGPPVRDAPDHGAPLLAARAPRAFVDLNRSVDELDPALIEGVRSTAHNPRVSSGLGVIPRVVANGRTIYRGKIALSRRGRASATTGSPTTPGSRG